MKTRNIAIVAVAAMLLATTAISSSTSYNAFAYKKNQATSQANACGSDFIPINVGCQNTDSQIQGDENSVALAAQQAFPEVEREKDHQRDHQRPFPPPDFGCPRNTVWDLTLDEQFGDLPAGTVICSFNGLGEQTVQIGDTEETLMVIIEEPNGGQPCSPFFEAHASSGQPPNELEIGDRVCVSD
jgi:hypothetical protein